jgi:hypothetical protein
MSGSIHDYFARRNDDTHALGRFFSVTGAATLPSALGADDFALRLRKLARSASRSRSALIRSLSSASLANAVLLCTLSCCLRDAKWHATTQAA